MAFTSKLYPGERVINDETPIDEEIIDEGMGRGYRPALRKVPFGEIPTASNPFPKELLIDESEFEARIKEAEKLSRRLSDYVNKAKLPCKNQEKTNYCWINAPVHCLEVTNVMQNQPMVILSPASAGAKLKNFRNVGGWGGEGLEFLDKMGCNQVEDWPANAIDRRYATDENAKKALKYRPHEWMEIQPKNLQEIVSLLLRLMPGAGGYNWWSHEITLYEPVWLDGTVAIRIRNSWGMNWPKPGAGGYSVLQGSRMYPDELVATRTLRAA